MIDRGLFHFSDFNLLLGVIPIEMADHGDDNSHASGGRWGDDDREHRRECREHRHHRWGDQSSFSNRWFLQMGPKPLIGGETPEAAEDWLARMESFFRSFQCSMEQKMETLDFLLESRASKWWKSAYAPLTHGGRHSTWADFRTSFMQLYFPPALRQAKTHELFNLKHGDLTVDEY